MKTILEFDPRRFSREALQLILAKAQEWKVTPAEAVSRLMDELALESGRRSRELRPAEAKA